VSRLINVEDFRRNARRRLPKVAFDFIDGGAEDEFAVRENRRAFEDLALRPAVLRGVGDEPRLSVSVAGQELSLPLIIGPTGGGRIAGPEGEVAAARAAVSAQTAAVISSGTSIPFAEICASAERPPWFQIVFLRDREWMEQLISRAESLGAPVLVVTADIPVPGTRERDVRAGLTYPVRPRLRWAPDLARHPRWLFNTLRHRAIIEEGLPEVSRENMRESLAELFDPAQSWADLNWVRERWRGPLLLKGVMRGEDAARAIDLGCDGIVVSNHGGRQLDAVASTLSVLPEVAAAVGDRGDVLFDGGVRRGTDVIKALALGADACMVGRPWLWGLAAGGAEGVNAVLDVFRKELGRAMILLGAADVGDLDESALLQRTGSVWSRPSNDAVRGRGTERNGAVDDDGELVAETTAPQDNER
jgi:isopentenyl diphosphate isomerase/L-lactate dehydrogenase-like FMN-dependent dehydrogenase